MSTSSSIADGWERLLDEDEWRVTAVRLAASEQWTPIELGSLELVEDGLATYRSLRSGENETVALAFLVGVRWYREEAAR